MEKPTQIADYVSKRMAKSERALALKIAAKLAQQPRAQPMTHREIARDAVAVAKIASKISAQKRKHTPGSRPREMSASTENVLVAVGERFNVDIAIWPGTWCLCADTALAMQFRDMRVPRCPLPDNSPAQNVLFVA